MYILGTPAARAAQGWKKGTGICTATGNKADLAILDAERLLCCLYGSPALEGSEGACELMPFSGEHR